MRVIPAASSGASADSQTNSLSLTYSTAEGIGSFDYKVSSETNWDRLEFYLNGVLLQRWSGEVGWATYQFAVPAGTNSFEWRYVKDANFSAGLDAAYIDNLFLPQNVPDPTDPSATLSLHRLADGACLIELAGQAARTYVLQASDDLTSWLALSTNVLGGNYMFIEDRQTTNQSLRFYRAIAR